MRVNLTRTEEKRWSVASLVHNHKGETFVGSAKTGATTMFYISRAGIIAFDSTSYASGAFWDMSNLVIFTVKRFCDAVVTEA